MKELMQDFAPWLEPLPARGDDASLCPRCQEQTAVSKTSRNSAGLVTRRRSCAGCGFRYTTVELLTFGGLVSMRDFTLQGGTK